MKVAAQSLVPIVVAIVTAVACTGNDPATTRRNAGRCATVAIATIPRPEGESVAEQLQRERRKEDVYQKCMEAAGEKCVRRPDGVLDCGESRR